MVQVDHRGYLLPQEDTQFIHCEVEKSRIAAIFNVFGTDENGIRLTKTAAINKALDFALQNK